MKRLITANSLLFSRLALAKVLPTFDTARFIAAQFGVAENPIKRLMLISILAPALTLASCATPVPPAICQPYYKADISADPTLDAKNIPAAGTGRVEKAQVGDTAIQRYLRARFPAGKVILDEQMLAPYPMTIGFNIDWSLKTHIEDRLTSAEVAVLSQPTTCTKTNSIATDSKTSLTNGANFEARVQASNAWVRKLKFTEVPSNSLLQPAHTHSADVYKIKNYKGSQMWLFTTPVDMKRADQKRLPSFEALGIWEQQNNYHMLLVRKFLVDDEGEILSEEFLLMPTPSIKSIKVLDSEHSMLWAKHDSFFDQRLIYNGLSGSTLKFLYREF